MTSKNIARRRSSRRVFSAPRGIGHALFDAAEHRGFEVRVGRRGGVCIAVKSHEYEITIIEELLRTPHKPTAAELARAERHSWFRVPSHDTSLSGKLQLRLPEAYDGAHYRWSDRERWQLDDKLPQILAEVAAEPTRRRAEAARCTRAGSDVGPVGERIRRR